MSNTLPQNKPKRSLAQKKDVAKISKEFYLKHIEGKVKEKAAIGVELESQFAAQFGKRVNEKRKAAKDKPKSQRSGSRVQVIPQFKSRQEFNNAFETAIAKSKQRLKNSDSNILAQNNVSIGEYAMESLNLPFHTDNCESVLFPASQIVESNSNGNENGDYGNFDLSFNNNNNNNKNSNNKNNDPDFDPNLFYPKPPPRLGHELTKEKKAVCKQIFLNRGDHINNQHIDTIENIFELEPQWPQMSSLQHLSKVIYELRLQYSMAKYRYHLLSLKQRREHDETDKDIFKLIPFLEHHLNAFQNHRAHIKCLQNYSIALDFQTRQGNAYYSSQREFAVLKILLNESKSELKDIKYSGIQDRSFIEKADEISKCVEEGKMYHLKIEFAETLYGKYIRRYDDKVVSMARDIMLHSDMYNTLLIANTLTSFHNDHIVDIITGHASFSEVEYYNLKQELRRREYFDANESRFSNGKNDFRLKRFVEYLGQTPKDARENIFNNDNNNDDGDDNKRAEFLQILEKERLRSEERGYVSIGEESLDTDIEIEREIEREFVNDDDDDTNTNTETTTNSNSNSNSNSNDDSDSNMDESDEYYGDNPHRHHRNRHENNNNNNNNNNSNNNNNNDYHNHSGLDRNDNENVNDSSDDTSSTAPISSQMIRPRGRRGNGKSQKNIARAEDILNLTDDSDDTSHSHGSQHRSHRSVGDQLEKTVPVSTPSPAVNEESSDLNPKRRDKDRHTHKHKHRNRHKSREEKTKNDKRTLSSDDDSTSSSSSSPRFSTPAGDGTDDNSSLGSDSSHDDDARHNTRQRDNRNSNYSNRNDQQQGRNDRNSKHGTPSRDRNNRSGRNGRNRERNRERERERGRHERRDRDNSNRHGDGSLDDLSSYTEASTSEENDNDKNRNDATDTSTDDGIDSSRRRITRRDARRQSRTTAPTTITARTKHDVEGEMLNKLTSTIAKTQDQSPHDQFRTIVEQMSNLTDEQRDFAGRVTKDSTVFSPEMIMGEIGGGGGDENRLKSGGVISDPYNEDDETEYIALKDSRIKKNNDDNGQSLRDQLNDEALQLLAVFNKDAASDEEDEAVSDAYIDKTLNQIANDLGFSNFDEMAIPDGEFNKLNNNNNSENENEILIEKKNDTSTSGFNFGRILAKYEGRGIDSIGDVGIDSVGSPDVLTPNQSKESINTMQEEKEKQSENRNNQDKTNLSSVFLHALKFPNQGPPKKTKKTKKTKKAQVSNQENDNENEKENESKQIASATMSRPTVKRTINRKPKTRNKVQIASNLD